MTPEHASADRTAFRRGKLLTLVLLAVTAVVFVWPEAHDAWFGPGPDRMAMHGQNRWVDFVGTCLVIGIVCASAWHGGELSTGCLTAFYSISLVTLVLVSVIFLILHAWSAYRDAGFAVGSWVSNVPWRGWGQATSFLVGGAWTIFAFWVLALSDDARLYRQARRRGETGADDSFSEWHQRP